MESKKPLEVGEKYLSISILNNQIKTTHKTKNLN